MKRLFVIATALFLSGCASHRLVVTYISDPPGAVLYENQTNTRFGYTPVTLYYNVPEADRKQGKTRLSGTTARWISGASASYNYIDADLARFGYRQTVTFRRPDDVPGRDTDEKFAFDLSNQRAQQNYQNQQLELQKQHLEEEKKQSQQKPYQIPSQAPAPVYQPTTTTCGWEFGRWVCRTR